MKKRGAKIKHGRCASPTLVALAIRPEVETAERTALMGLTSSWGNTSHFNVLLDCQQMLVLAASHKHDDEAVKMGQAADVALKNIRDRWHKTGRVGVTGDERAMLGALIDYSADWWRRQSGALFADAYIALDRLRIQQREAA